MFVCLFKFWPGSPAPHIPSSWVKIRGPIKKVEVICRNPSGKVTKLHDIWKWLSIWGAGDPGQNLNKQTNNSWWCWCVKNILKTITQFIYKLTKFISEKFKTFIQTLTSLFFVQHVPHLHSPHHRPGPLSNKIVKSWVFWIFIYSNFFKYIIRIKIILIDFC